MLGRASLIAIVVGSAVYWLLEGLWMGLLMGDYYMNAFAIFEPVARTEQLSPMMWLFSTTLIAALLMWIGQRSAVSVAGMATTGAVLFGVTTFNMEFMMYMFFADYPLMPTSLISVVWESVAGAVTGGVMGMTYMKLNKG